MLSLVDSFIEEAGREGGPAVRCQGVILQPGEL
jgi:hypothetical protein